jgi:transmembrane sensor
LLLTSIETIRALAEKWLEGTITPEEERIFETWYNREKPEKLNWLSAKSERELKNRMFKNILHKIEEESVHTPTHKVRSLKTSWIKYAAAIVIVLGVAAYLWNTQKNNVSPALSTTNGSVPVKNDIAAPVTSRAMITLASGQKIFVDSVASGNLATEGGVSIEKKEDGQIIYTGNAVGQAVQYNTLTVPRGSQVAGIVLSDGTKVFLNAGTVLTYPVSFAGSQRRVQMDGEAYFEVAKDAKRKFIVSSNGVETEVLGTHFNVNAYRDESMATITLLEGRVKIKAGHSLITLDPLQQAAASPNSLKKNANANVDQVMAWKNGRFLTGGEDVDIQAFLRQVSRWYDVDIQYTGNITGTVGGTLSRQVSVSKVLELLESTGSTHYKMEGKTVIISPVK